MTTPPPPPGGGDNQPYNPSGNTPNPSSGSGSMPSNPTPGGPTYGSGPAGGMPPQAPPPMGGLPQQGGSKNGQIMSIISIVTGVLGLCCCTWFIFSIAAVVLGILGAKEYDKTGEKKILAQIGLGLGVAGIVIGIIYWILILTGVVDSTFNFSSNL